MARFSIYRLTIFATFTFLGAQAHAGAVIIGGNGSSSISINGDTIICNGSIINNVCYLPCNGDLSITDTEATCNGAPLKRADGQASTSPPPPNLNVCGGDVSAHVHANGGGVVADSAQVESTVKVGRTSKVCGTARVTGESSLINSTVTDSAIVRDSSLTNSKVTGRAQVESSNLVNSGATDNALVSAANMINSSASYNATARGNLVNKNLR